MRIGEFTDSFIPIVDGVGRVVLAYSEHLGRRGNELSVIAPMDDTGYRGNYPFELIDFISTDLPAGFEWKAGVPYIDSHYRARIRSVPFDIVHSHSPFVTGFEALRIATKLDIPLVSTFHSKYYDDFLKLTHSEAVSKIGVKTIIDYYDQCDEVWAVSSSTAEVLESYGYKGTITVMENGSDLLPPDKQGNPSELKAIYDIPDLPTLLFVGQMNWKKNILLILEAVAKLKQEGLTCELILVGMGPDENEIRRKVDELGLNENTKIPGHVEDISVLDGFYRLADIFVFPSIYDNAPMVVREAARAGTPPILARESSAAEIVEDGVNGRLCENDVDDLARVIREMLADPKALEAMGEKARTTIPKPWDTIIDKVEARYRYLIDNHSVHKNPIEKARDYLKDISPLFSSMFNEED
ncbi:MAG: glycosyltransferase [Oscillospiraceae bacterium]|nr:glycosyltransferase [Oscillospiraceae bacterium]MBR0451084.1 glycosyltransferase [Oscillospiraceae bacterium]